MFMLGINQIKTFTVGVLVGLTILCSCSKDKIRGSVSGTINIYDPETPSIKTPIKGINVLLVNMNYVVDSLDYAHNEAAVVGNGTTDSDGKYLIVDIPIGNYAVVPIPDSIMYRFELENENDSVKFSIQKEMLDYTLDFKAPEMVGNDDVFQIRITIINRPGGGSISLVRPVFLFNIFPTYSPISMGDSFTTDADDMTLYFHQGIFTYLYVVANNLRVSTFDNAGYYLFSRWVVNDYFNTPKYSHWQINWSANTISRIE